MRRVSFAAAVLLALSGMSNAGWPAARAALPQSSSPPASSQAKPEPKFQPPVILETADAVYPIKSVAFGTVVLEVHLTAAGEIEDARVARDIPSLTEPALAAIKHWKFQAATLDGKPVASVVPVAFIFVRPDLQPRYGGPPQR
jgi:TonB family protein